MVFWISGKKKLKFFYWTNCRIFIYNFSKDNRCILLRKAKTVRKNFLGTFQDISEKNVFSVIFSKKSCDFLYWKNFRFIFFRYFKSRIYDFSKGNKNKHIKILNSFRGIWETLEKFFAKKGIFYFDEIFWKKEHSDFFREYSKSSA